MGSSWNLLPLVEGKVRGPLHADHDVDMFKRSYCKESVFRPEWYQYWEFGLCRSQRKAVVVWRKVQNVLSL